MTQSIGISTIDVEVSKANAILEVKRFADLVPSIVIIHELPSLSISFLSNLGLDLIGCSMEEVRSMSNEDFQRRFLNTEAAAEYTPKILDLLDQNGDVP